MIQNKTGAWLQLTSMPPKTSAASPRGQGSLSVYSPFAYAIVAYAVANLQRLNPHQLATTLSQLDDILAIMLSSLRMRACRTSLTATTTPGSHLREARLLLAIALRHLRAGRSNRLSLRRVAPY